MSHARLISFPTRRRRLVAPLLLALAAGAGALLAARAAVPAGSPGPDRLRRQVGVMEGIIDKVLLDSPNLLVSGREYTRGVVLPDYGVVFSFNAAPNDNDLRFGDLSPLGFSFDFNKLGDGNFIVAKRGHSSEPDADNDDSEAEKEREKDKEALVQAGKELERAKKEAARLRDKLRDKEVSLHDWEKERQEKSRELYDAGRQELVQALLDYGETMTELKDGQWIVLAGFFDRNSFLRDSKATRLVLRAKIDDLRACAAGRLGEAAARERIVVEEY
jgi:hypothetical protein